MASGAGNGSRKFPPSRAANLVDLAKQSSKFQTRSRESLETVKMSAEKSLRKVPGTRLGSKLRKRLSFGRVDKYDLSKSKEDTVPVQLTKKVSKDMFEESQDADLKASASDAQPQRSPIASSDVGLTVSPQQAASSRSPLPSSEVVLTVPPQPTTSSDAATASRSPLPSSEVGLIVSPQTAETGDEHPSSKSPMPSPEVTVSPLALFSGSTTKETVPLPPSQAPITEKPQLSSPPVPVSQPIQVLFSNFESSDNAAQEDVGNLNSENADSSLQNPNIECALSLNEDEQIQDFHTSQETSDPHPSLENVDIDNTQRNP